jgi:hypothetical protein
MKKYKINYQRPKHILLFTAFLGICSSVYIIWPIIEEGVKRKEEEQKNKKLTK